MYIVLVHFTKVMFYTDSLDLAVSEGRYPYYISNYYYYYYILFGKTLLI